MKSILNNSTLPPQKQESQATGLSPLHRTRRGFSLAELLAALIISALVLVSVLEIYSRANKSSNAVLNKIKISSRPQQLLQLIAEDLDRIVHVGADDEGITTTITVQNSYDQLFPTATLTMETKIFDANNTEITFEKIVYKAAYDFESFTPALILYRSHTGVATEDRLHQQARADWEHDYTYIPVCQNITFFRVEVLTGNEPLFEHNDYEYLDIQEQPLEPERRLATEWNDAPPPGLVITVSFAEPFQSVDGTLDVPEEEKIARVIAIARTRTIEFSLSETETGIDPNTMLPPTAPEPNE